MTKTIFVASHNPVKIRATLAGFQALFPAETFVVDGVSVSSGVSDQPLSDAETLRGALNRAQTARTRAPNANFWVGIEGGVEFIEGDLLSFAWVVVLGDSLMGKGRSGSFFLPPAVAELVKAGKELGEADDLVFQQQNSKQGDGAIGILTGNAIDRTALYIPAVIFALLPFSNSRLYA